MIIERYIHREILQRLIWIAGLLFLIFATNKFVDYLGDAAAGKIPTDFISKFLWLKMLAIQTEVLPLVLFLAVILTYSRLHRDNELTILAVAGIGTARQLQIVARFSVVFCLLIALISFYAAPWAKSNIIKLKEQAWQESIITGIAAGQFKELNKGDSIVYVEELSDDKNTMENVFLQIRQKDKNNVMRSDMARFNIDKSSGNRFIIFENGKRYSGTPGMLDYQITQYEKYGVLVETGEAAASTSIPETLPTSDLLGSDSALHRAELQWRISSILACLLLALLAVLLNQLSLGQKPYTLLFVSILIYLIYSNLLSISKTLLERDKISPLLGLWWVHMVLIVMGMIIYYFPVFMRWRKRDRQLQVLPAGQ
ncbi:MAG: export transporter permease LptF [Gammaproteobacteria bacterium]|nr:export transporter permease LptF [Gammaproteobacteria bacterium]